MHKARAAPVAKKRFGQHFLHEAGVIDRIIRSLRLRADDAVVEIGPGRGALTRPLLAALPALTVIEIDRDVIPALQALGATHGGLRIIQGDVLDIDFTTLAAGRPLRLVGNLPYNISTPLLFHVLTASAAVRDMHFMLQKEVVDRICAQPGTADYGRLTVTLNARADAAALFNVGPGAFTPPPQVESAVVRIVPRPAPFPIADLGRFDMVVQKAFAQRRKTLANALRGVLDAPQIRAAGIDPGIRAERLPPEAFARLAGQLA